MNLVTRSDWGAVSAVSPSPMIQIPAKKLWLHHTVADVHGPGGMRRLEEDALSEGYTDIEYNFCTDDDATSYEGRGGGHKSAAQNAPGGHDNNSESQAICAFGNFETKQPTQLLINGLGDLVAFMFNKGWIDRPVIDGPHRDAPGCSTACCGKNLIARIPDINAHASGAKPPAKQTGGAMDIVRTPSGHGYYIVSADGGVFCYGDAKFFGSMGGQKLNAPVVDMAVHPKNSGYILASADGGVFCFGNVQFKGSMGGKKLNAPIVGCEIDAEGDGYWLLGQDGGVFTFGKTDFYGSASGKIKYP
jgi:hypothetical protein